MSGPIGRRPSDALHDRARTLAAERLWEVLDAGDARWLDRHLKECPDCRAVADSYQDQRRELRALRNRQPIPPRDLWARTAAAIEREDARRRPSLRPEAAARTPILRRKRPSPVPLGAVAGLLVVAVVVGVSLLGGRRAPIVSPRGSSPIVAQASPSLRSLVPAHTPIVLAAGDVEDVSWMRIGSNGQVDVFTSPIEQVCADAGGPDCAPIEEPSPRTGDLTETTPQTVLMSPKKEQLVLVPPQTGDGSGKVVVVAVPTAPGTTPAPTPSARVTPTPPAATATPPTTTATPSPVTATPTPPTGTASPPIETPSPTPPTESPSPVPPGGPLEIATDVVVVGQSAAYSEDGAWFAFSARPSDGSHGPDIYVWRVGDPAAAPITDDHRSVFAGWLSGRVLGSRAVVAPGVDPGVSPSPSNDPEASAASPTAPADVRPESFLIDPATSELTVLVAAPFWRPSVDPTRTRAVYWDGTLTLADNGLEWRPATGRLVVGPWPALPEPSSQPGASGQPTEIPGVTPDAPPSVSPDVSSEPSSSPSPASSPSTEPAATPLTVESSAIRDWDARWDETGSRLAVWIADEADPTIGRLSLYVVDKATGAFDLAHPLLSSQPALPGFSIGSGRLAWAAPPNQDGEGSHVEVLAWTGDDSGKVESTPGQDQVVVIR